MSRPRLACLISGLGAVERGAERATLDLVRHLAADFDVTVFGRRAAGPGVRATAALDRTALTPVFDGLPSGLARAVRRLHLTPVEIEMLTFSLAALPRLWRDRYDAHLLVTGVWGARLARLLRAARGVPFVYLGHGGPAGELPNARQRPDLHVFVSPFVQQEVARRVPGLRTAFIPNGVDLERFVPRPSTALDGLERPVYLAAGALVAEKRIDLAVRAVASLPTGSLAVLGHGPEADRIDRLGATLLGSGRFRLGAAPFDAMPAYYAACDVFTLPSHAEPFGLVYLEAMACGKPVVAPRDEMREWVIGDAGVLCRCEDLEQYAAALKRAAHETMGEDPRRRAERFDVRQTARAYARAINGVLAEHRA